MLLGLNDPSDDVIAVAASALLPVVPLLISGLADGQVRQLAATLWAALLHLDDLTCSTHAILLLLSELLAAPGGLEAIAACSAAENAASGSEKPLAELVPRLFPFLSHASSVVRRASLQASGCGSGDPVRSGYFRLGGSEYRVIISDPLSTLKKRKYLSFVNWCGLFVHLDNYISAILLQKKKKNHKQLIYGPK